MGLGHAGVCGEVDPPGEGCFELRPGRGLGGSQEKEQREWDGGKKKVPGKVLELVFSRLWALEEGKAVGEVAAARSCVAAGHGQIATSESLF